MVGKRVIHLDDMGSDSTASDPLVIFDRSENKTKRIDRSKLAEAIVADLPYNPTPGWSATTIPEAIAEIANEVGNTPDDVLVSYQESDIPSPTANEGVLSDGSFPTNPKTEVADLLSGNNAAHTLPKTGPLVGQVIFCPVQEMTTGGYHHRTYRVPADSVYTAVPLMHIRCFSPSSVLDTRLFRPVNTSLGGILGFQCVSSKPIHTVINGGLSVLFRVGTDVNARVQLRLALVGIDIPSIELSANQLLGRSVASLDDEPRALIQSEFMDFIDGSLNPLDGLWVRKNIPVCQDVVFYPNSTYYFGLTYRVISGSVTPTAYQYRYESGGFSCVYDASLLGKQLASSIVGS